MPLIPGWCRKHNLDVFLWPSGAWVFRVDYTEDDPLCPKGDYAVVRYNTDEWRAIISDEHLAGDIRVQEDKPVMRQILMVCIAIYVMVIIAASLKGYITG